MKAQTQPICRKIGFWHSNHKQPSPTRNPFCLNACLESYMTITRINTLEHLLCAQCSVVMETTEGTPWAIGLQGLVLQYFCHNEVLHSSVTIDQTDFLPDRKIGRASCRER